MPTASFTKDIETDILIRMDDAVRAPEVKIFTDDVEDDAPWRHVTTNRQTCRLRQKIRWLLIQLNFKSTVRKV